MNLLKRRRLLFLAHLYPTAMGSGTQIRAAAMIRMLSRESDVYLIVLNRDEHVPGPRDLEMEKNCREIHCLSWASLVKSQLPAPAPVQPSCDVKPVPMPLLDVAGQEKINPVLHYFQERELDELFLFTMVSFSCIENCFRRFPHRSLDLDELISAREGRIAQLKLEDGRGRSDPVEQTKLRTWQVLERAVIPAFDPVFVSSEIEQKRLKSLMPGVNVHVLPNIRPVQGDLTVKPAAHPREILFVGSLGYFPNQDAVLFFAREIFPLIRAKNKSVLFRVIGFDCPPLLRNFQEEGVEITGYAEELKSWYERASIVVVPLRAGGGTRLKILEAFAYGRPVVSTSIGAEGLPVSTGKNILLTDTAESFAEACLNLLDQPARAAELVAGGLEMVQENYSDKDLRRRYEAALDALIV